VLAAAAGALGAALVGAGARSLVGVPETRPARAAGNRVSAIGASQVAAIGAGDTIELDGFVGWAWLLGSDRVRSHRPEAAGGYHLADVRDRLLPQLLAHRPRPDWCIVHAGTNDAGGGDPDAMLATAAEIYDRLLGEGIVPIATSLPPQATTRNLATLSRFNDGVRAAARRRGVPFADLFAAVVDPASGTFRSGLHTDAVHLSPAGARLAGQAVADALRAVLPSWPPPLPTAADAAGSDLLLANPLMLADGDGDGMPDGWTVAGNATDVRCALVDGGDACEGNWFEVVKTDNARPTVLQTAAAPVRAGAAVAVGYRCEVVAGQDPPNHSATFRTDTGRTLRRVGYAQGYEGDVPPHATYLETTVPAGAKAAFLQLSLGGRGTFRIGQLLLRDQTGSG
jgi:lysophospholipase L1-like esterase